MDEEDSISNTVSVDFVEFEPTLMIMQDLTDDANMGGEDSLRTDAMQSNIYTARAVKWSTRKNGTRRSVTEYTYEEGNVEYRKIRQWTRNEQVGTVQIATQKYESWYSQ